MQHENPLIESSRAGVVVDAARALLAQCVAFVGDVPEAVFTAESQVMPGGTVGKHLRHVADHYAAILRARRDSATIDYDHRERDVPMEACRDTARRTLASVSDELSTLTERDMHAPVRIRVMVAGDGTETELASSLARELAFATHHAVHHQAMMRAIAGEFGVEASTDFGKAPSTINHDACRAARNATP
jgi:hypothetical protein